MKSKEPTTEVAVRAAPASMAFAEMQQLAEAIAKSRLFGITTPDQALVLMAISQAEGRHPALAARDYDIIQGRPAKKAEAMMRDFLSAGGSVEWHQLDENAADATFSHPQGGSARIKWDMGMAHTAGLAGKENWRKHRRAMLRSRVVSEGVRTVCPAATSGFYVGEEVIDIGPREPIDVTPKAELDKFATEESPVEAHRRIYAEAEAEFAASRNTPANPAAIVEDYGLFAVAEAEARKGLESFRSFWRTLNETQRSALDPHIDRLEKLVQAAAPKPEAAAPEPHPAETVDPPEPPQVFSFANEHGEVFEFDSVLDAASALIMVLDSTTEAGVPTMIWESAASVRQAVRGNGNLGAEVDSAYERAAARVSVSAAGNGLDEEARKAAAGGLRKFHQWWLRIEPAQRKELAARRPEYEAIARASPARTTL